MVVLEIAGYYLLVTLVWRFSRFITTPILRWVGYYTYYSKLFFTMPIGIKTLDFHLGTSWDFFHQKKISVKGQVEQLIEGMIHFCTAIEEGKIAPETKLTGTTFYMKDSSLKRFGFKSRKLNPFEIFLFVLNFLELNLLFSIAHKRLAIIPLGIVRVVYTTAGEVVNYKEELIHLLKKLNPKAEYFNSNIIKQDYEKDMAA